jgi:hypothetical protein
VGRRACLEGRGMKRGHKVVEAGRIGLGEDQSFHYGGCGQWGRGGMMKTVTQKESYL